MQLQAEAKSLSTPPISSHVVMDRTRRRLIGAYTNEVDLSRAQAPAGECMANVMPIHQIQ